MSKAAKKLVSVLATSTLMTGTREKALEYVPCIHYLVQFKWNITRVQALIDLESEVNTIYPFFAKQLGFSIWPTDVGPQKIDGTTLDTHKIVVVAFSVVYKANWVRFFEKTFLVANVSPEVVFEILFLTLSGANIDFSDQKLWWRTYTTNKALPTTKHVKLVGKKEFTALALDSEYETYVVHIASLGFTLLIASTLVTYPDSTPLNVHPSQRPQIFGLIAKEASMKVPVKYLDFADVFSPGLISELPVHTGINDHAIKLVNGQQPPYGPIYSLRLIEVKTLKTYIETNLANGFIRPSKSPCIAPILFDQKSDNSLRLCMNYQGLNNPTIKNQYLPLIGDSLDRLGRAQQFTQLDLTSAYYQMRTGKGDEWKTAFRTWYCHFKYQVMPFGPTNAPASFQGYIKKIFVTKLDIFVIMYLDNIFIYTNDDREGHIVAIWWMLEQLMEF